VPGAQLRPAERQRFREIAVDLPTWDTRAENVPATSRPEICIPVFRCSGGQAHQLKRRGSVAGSASRWKIHESRGGLSTELSGKATRTTFDATPLSAFAVLAPISARFFEATTCCLATQQSW